MKHVVNLSIYLLFFSIFFLDGFLGSGLDNRGLQIIPGRLSWLCEILACLIAVLALVIFAIRKKIFISISFLFFFFTFFVFILAGIIFNAVPFGAVFSGIRRYLLFLPLFFLPVFYEISIEEVKNQLKVLLFFSLVQIPFSIFQRFYIFKTADTGDLVTGSLLSSTVLTLNQLFAIAILTAIFIKKQIHLSLYLIILLLLFFPTTINETKATLILFPIAIAVPVIFGSGKIINFKKIFLVIISVTVVAAIFIPLYSYLYNDNIIEFFEFSGEDKGTRTIQGYLYKGLSTENFDEKAEPGRIDSLLFPIKIFQKEPFKMLFGLGIGNVNPSGISKFEGEYTKKYAKFGANAIAAGSMIWEIGLIGLFFYILFFTLILSNAFKLMHGKDLFGAIALGWIAIICMLFLCLFYANIFHIKAVGFLFYYGSGLIVAKQAALMESQQKIASYRQVKPYAI